MKDNLKQAQAIVKWYLREMQQVVLSVGKIISRMHELTSYQTLAMLPRYDERIRNGEESMGSSTQEVQRSRIEIATVEGWREGRSGRQGQEEAAQGEQMSDRVRFLGTCFRVKKMSDDHDYAKLAAEARIEWDRDHRSHYVHELANAIDTQAADLTRFRDQKAALMERIAALEKAVVDAREIIADVADGFEWADKSILEDWLTKSQITAPSRAADDSPVCEKCGEAIDPGAPDEPCPADDALAARMVDK